MDKEVCFLIDDNTLFLDHVLVAFNDIPIFFVCCDNNEKQYLVLCIDIDALEYIIVECSLWSMHQMLSGEIEMRTPFVSSKQYWNVKTGDSIEQDDVQCLNGESMDSNVLPYTNAFYEAKSADDKKYVNEISSRFFMESIRLVPLFTFPPKAFDSYREEHGSIRYVADIENSASLNCHEKPGKERYTFDAA